MASSQPIDYQHLFRSLPENFLLIGPDAEATILDNTDAHVVISLKPREEIVGKPFFEAFPAVDQNEGDVIAESHEHVRRHREPHTMPLIRYDLELPAEQGGGFEERYWQATHYPVLAPDGQLRYIVQRAQDVTEQQRIAREAARMQQELLESQERTRFILDSLPVLIWTANPQGQRDYFNPRWLAYTGRSAEEQRGLGWTESIHDEDRARVLDAWQRSVQEGSPYQVEYRLRRHDGQYRWILVRAAPRRDASGAITMWVGGATDIHDQRQLVQELLEANEQQAALAEQAYRTYQEAEAQRETYFNLFMQAPAMICILRGPEHRYEFVNPGYQRIFPHRQLQGRTVAEALPEIRDQGILKLLDDVYATGETFYGNELKLQLERDESGELRDAYFNFIYQQFREHGQPAGIMVFAFEVTDLVQARHALERLTGGADAAPATDPTAIP